MIYAHNVYSVAKMQEHYALLYSMLIMRLNEPHTNISHIKLPSWEDHVKFVDKDPYKHWFIVYKAETHDLVGQYYITKSNEIGIYVIEKYRNKGYGHEIMQCIFTQNPDVELYANINPENKSSIAFFKRYGFELIQHTYKKAINQSTESS